MSEIKYTKDGKKVVVLGDLNKNEKIVQEIFIINDQEVPSGENFVVTTLHDAPAISWKEKKIKELEETYDKQKKYWDDRLENLRKKKRALEYEYESFIHHWKQPVEDKHLQETIDRIIRILTGKITHVIIDSYCSDFKIVKFEDAILRSGESSIDRGLKMMTIFGTTKGRFDTWLNEYSDGSGSKRKVWCFESEEEAVEFIIEECKRRANEKKEVTGDQIRLSETYNFELPKEYVDAYFDKQIGQYVKYIDQEQKKIDGYNEKIKEYKERKLPTKKK